MNQLKDFLHRLTHSHLHATKAGLGKIDTCGWRCWPWTDVYFTPAGYGKAIFRLDSRDDALQQVLACENAAQAIALCERLAQPTGTWRQ